MSPMGSNGFTWYLNNVCRRRRCVISTPSCNSFRYACVDFVDFGGVDESVAVSSTEGEDVVDEEPLAGVGWSAAGGMDLRASVKTSTVSRRSDAKRVIAKSRCCSFSRAAFR